MGIFEKYFEYKMKKCICGIPYIIVEGTAEDYKKILVEEIDNPTLPIVFNVNIGHAQPRCIIPFGIDAKVDAEKQVIKFEA